MQNYQILKVVGEDKEFTAELRRYKNKEAWCLYQTLEDGHVDYLIEGVTEKFLDGDAIVFITCRLNGLKYKSIADMRRFYK